MLIYSRPLYHSMPTSSHPWPRTITCSVSRFGVSTWTLIYDNGTHRVIVGRLQMESINPELTSVGIASNYLLSRKA